MKIQRRARNVLPLVPATLLAAFLSSAGTSGPDIGGVASVSYQPPTALGMSTEVIDFESFATGTIVSSVFGSLGSGPVMVRAMNPALGMVNAGVVFDTSFPTGEDEDLGTPNETFGGPGIGIGGEMGSPFENGVPGQGKMLIVAEDLVDGDGDMLVDDPDDADEIGARVFFAFGSVGPVRIERMTIVDVEADRPGAEVFYFGPSGAALGSDSLPIVGDNGKATVELGVDGVGFMVVLLNGSGAIDDVEFSTPCTGRIGDLVWNDLDCNGIQDTGEPGIPGVTMQLKDDTGAVVAATMTNLFGRYSFDDVCAGDYTVCVDEATLPPNFIPAPCNVGLDDAVDNDCSPAPVTLPENDSRDRTIDFGYCEVAMGEGCTPGYWKQPHHFDSWPVGYIPDMQFSAVFEDAFPGLTLAEVLAQGGGGLQALGRHTVAALLSAGSGISFGLTEADVVMLFDTAFPGSDPDLEALKGFFEELNEQGCPLN